MFFQPIQSAVDFTLPTRLIIRTLKGLPLDERIAKLEDLLAEKPEVAAEMESVYEAYRGVLQKALDEARASHPNPTSQS